MTYPVLAHSQVSWVGIDITHGFNHEARTNGYRARSNGGSVDDHSCFEARSRRVKLNDVLIQHCTRSVGRLLGLCTPRSVKNVARELATNVCVAPFCDLEEEKRIIILISTRILINYTFSKDK